MSLPPDIHTPALPYPEGSLLIESLDLEARGVARREDGKVVFVEGALPFERVSANVNRRKNNWEQASLVAIHRESSQRVVPHCPHFGLHTGSCGGCKMQHLHPAAQVAVKQRVLEDNLWHLGKVKPETMLRPIEGPAWAYRYRARLSIRYVRKRGEVLVGFHERKSHYVADIRHCAVLPAAVSAMLMPLRALIHSLDARETCPQIELACGDDVIALVLRHLAPLSPQDLDKLRAFAQMQSVMVQGVACPLVEWWLQPKGPETAHLLPVDGLPDAAKPISRLHYTLPEFGIDMPFKPTDFTQVNPSINRVLVALALKLLAVKADEQVIDWFCGLGNFTLPLATQALGVLGVEGSEALVERSRQNYEKNRPAAHDRRALCATKFIVKDIFGITPDDLSHAGPADKWLIDPPREGAFELVNALAALIAAPETGVPQTVVGQPDALGPSPVPTEACLPPSRIVYISCNPSTLARDAGILVHQAGYRCTSAGVVNMFPHTAHVESIAVFER